LFPLERETCSPGRSEELESPEENHSKLFHGDVEKKSLAWASPEAKGPLEKRNKNDDTARKKILPPLGNKKAAYLAAGSPPHRQWMERG